LIEQFPVIFLFYSVDNERTNIVLNEREKESILSHFWLIEN